MNSLFDKKNESATMQKNGEAEINELNKLLQEREEMVKLLKDGIQLRDRKLEDLKMGLDLLERL